LTFASKLFFNPSGQARLGTKNAASRLDRCQQDDAFVGPGDEILSFSRATTLPRDQKLRQPALNMFLHKSPACAPSHKCVLVARLYYIPCCKCMLLRIQFGTERAMKGFSVAEPPKFFQDIFRNDPMTLRIAYRSFPLLCYSRNPFLVRWVVAGVAGARIQSECAPPMGNWSRWPNY